MELWAKSNPYYPLIYHLIDAGCMAQILLSKSTFSYLTPKLSELFQVDSHTIVKNISFISALHDIGKCSPFFQQKDTRLDIVKFLQKEDRLETGNQSRFLHEELSAKIVRDKLKEFRWPRAMAGLLSSIVLFHHQRHNPGKGNPEENASNKDWWKELRGEIMGELEAIFRPSGTISVCHHADVAGSWLLGLLILSDWLVSTPQFFEYQGFDGNLDDYYNFSLKRCERLVAELGFNNSGGMEGFDSLDLVWPNLASLPKRPLQVECEKMFQEDLPPGLLIIEAPMGEGKTEAGVYAAIRWMDTAGCQGMYVALPTAATSNQMYSRIKDFIKMHELHNKVRLLHGMAWLVDDGELNLEANVEEDENTVREWLRPLRRGLLTPWAVGTVDQAMMSALKVRYGSLRQLGLSNKVLIIDEVHSYDTYMSTIIDRLLRWCGEMGVPVILLSATLQVGRKGQLLSAYAGQDLPEEYQTPQAYPLITYINSSGAVKYAEVQGTSNEKQVQLAVLSGGLNHLDRVAEKAIDTVKLGGCLCIFMNTVTEAQQLYQITSELLKEMPEYGEIELILFHGRFCAGDRDKIEKRCLQAFDKQSIGQEGEHDNPRPKRAIVIATQVVEQSLDLDFDFMFSALAPIDLLLQRMGRLFRHMNRLRLAHIKAPVFTLLTPEEVNDMGLTGKVYHPYILLLSLQELENKKVVKLPQDISSLINKVYSAEPPERNTILWEHWHNKCSEDRDFERNANQFLIPSPRKEIFWLPANQINYDDDESKRWFKAKTRIGKESVQTLLLEKEEYQLVVETEGRISKEETARLILNYVNLPRWWLQHLITVGNEDANVQGKGKLSGFTLLPMEKGVFEGKFNGEVRRIVKDEVYGLRKEGV